MKRLCMLIGVFFMLISLAGCGSKDPDVCTYTVFAYGAENHEDITGAVINFCTETACYPVVTGDKGKAVFTGPPAKYHVQVIQSPEGWQPQEGADADFYTEPCDQIFHIPFKSTE